MHCVNGFSSTDTSALRCRNLSCFCHACMHGQWRRCANKAHVEAWQYLRIIPIEADIDEYVTSDKEIDAPMYANHHDDFSDALWVGDNFVVNADEEDSDFYILRCCTEKRLCTANQKVAWHNQIKKNSYYVEGHFYDKVVRRSDQYELFDDRPPPSMYSHLV
ncbi:hypothetical protein L7F22_051542 [Adiantum nelumboides]|nr:hypothetical protein [Adiantum nelumboides]